MSYIQFSEISIYAKKILDKIKNDSKKDKSYIIAFEGDLGSGKTAMTKAIANELNIKEEITSPTFVILKRYNIEFDIFTSLIHIDAYRLSKYDELKKINFEKYMEDEKNLIIIEWPEMIKDSFDDYDMKVKFEYGNHENERIIQIL